MAFSYRAGIGSSDIEGSGNTSIGVNTILNGSEYGISVGYNNYTYKMGHSISIGCNNICNYDISESHNIIIGSDNDTPAIDSIIIGSNNTLNDSKTTNNIIISSNKRLLADSNIILHTSPNFIEFTNQGTIYISGGTNESDGSTYAPTTNQHQVYIGFGSAYTTYITDYGNSWSAPSDMNDKIINIKISPNKALNFISSLDVYDYSYNRRQEYNYDIDSIDDYNEDDISTLKTDLKIPDDVTDIKKYITEKRGLHPFFYDKSSHKQGTKKQKETFIGLMAQEVNQKLIEFFGSSKPSIVKNLSDSDEESNMILTYLNLLPFLIASIKELNNNIK